MPGPFGPRSCTVLNFQNHYLTLYIKVKSSLASGVPQETPKFIKVLGRMQEDCHPDACLEAPYCAYIKVILGVISRVILGVTVDNYYVAFVRT